MLSRRLKKNPSTTDCTDESSQEEELLQAVNHSAARAVAYLTLIQKGNTEKFSTLFYTLSIVTKDTID